MADMVQKFSAVTLSNEILIYEIYMTAAIVTKTNEGSSLIIIQKFIIFFKSFNLHREHRNIVNHLGSRLISSGCARVGTGPSTRGEKRMIPTACLSRVKQYEAAKDRYFHLAASYVPLPFELPVVPSLSSSSFYPPVGIRGPPSEGCKQYPIPPACRALSSRGLLRTARVGTGPSTRGE